MHRQPAVSVKANQRTTRSHFITMALGLSSIAFFVSYIVLANHVSTSGYELARVQSEVSAAQSNLESVALAVSAAKALNRIEAEAVSLSLVPVGVAEYGSATTAVAIR